MRTKIILNTCALFFNAILAIGGVAFCLYTANNLCATKKQIEESREQNIATNEPILQVDGVKIITFEIGKRIEMQIDIVNLGTSPVRLVLFRGIIPVQKYPGKYDLIFDDKITTRFEPMRYVAKTHPFKGLKLADPIIMSEGKANALLNQGYFIYLSLYVQYNNLITGSMKQYKATVKVDPVGRTVPELIFSENSHMQ